jgi:putative ABC transport system permease protein
MLGDIRYALRTLGASPGFTIAAVLTLALGIGANTAIFTAVYGVLLKPLPYGDPDRLMRIAETRRGGSWNVAYPNYIDWRARNHVFDEMAIFNTYKRVIIAGDGMAADTYGAGTCETQMLPLMGIQAARGRLFTEDEKDEKKPLVAVITDAVWRKRFGGDPAIVGQAVRMDDDAITVVGVLPPGVRPFDVDVWFPIRPKQMTPMQLDRANHPGFGVVARLRPGIDAEQAQREMSAIAASLAREYPASNSEMGVSVKPMIDAVAGDIRPTLRLLMTAVAVLLLIACANVANLLLAKGLRRERETSIRSALGASRVRLVRLFLIEGITLGAAGAAGGLLLAGWGVRLLRDVPGLDLPRASEVAIDPYILAFAAALGIATAVLFALAPALQLSRVDLMRVLRQAGTDGATRRAARLRSGLVAIEVALLIVLLAGASLMLRSLGNLASIHAGFDADRVLSVPLRQLQSRYGNNAAVTGFADRLLSSVKSRPGVEGAAMAWPFDYTGFTWAPSINLPDHPFEPGREPPAQTAAVTPGYFGVMGIPIRQGRDFGPDERPGAPVSVVINETFATRFFPGEDPIGKRVTAMRIPEMENMRVIGVVGDTRRGGMLRGFTPEIYIAYAQFPQSGATLVVRAAAGDPLLLSSDLKAQVAHVDSDTAPGTARVLSTALAQTYGDRRALSWLLMVFAGLALGLTILGIASVVSFTVAQRVPEIGVRIALGANRGDVVKLLVFNSLYPVSAGGALGLLALVPLSRAFRSYLYDISPADPVSLAASAAILLVAAVGAAYVPARRASSIDPLTALRRS